MITYVQGDLFKSNAQVLTNTVNTVGVMGKGVALEFKKRFPVMFEDYKRLCETGGVKPGVPYLWENDEVQILNFPTKRHWKNQSRLEDIEAGLQYLAQHYGEMGIQSLAMPPLGCGLGGLDWKDVRLLIEKYLREPLDLDVYVYEPAKASIRTKDDETPSVSGRSSSDEWAASPV